MHMLVWMLKIGTGVACHPVAWVCRTAGWQWAGMNAVAYSDCRPGVMWSGAAATWLDSVVLDGITGC